MDKVENGLCLKCYGLNLGEQRKSKTRWSCWVVATQSIGEPGTQLTLRTFHVGELQVLLKTERELKADKEGFIRYYNIKKYVKSDGKIIICK